MKNMEKIWHFMETKKKLFITCANWCGILLAIAHKIETKIIYNAYTSTIGY